MMKRGISGWILVLSMAASGVAAVGTPRLTGAAVQSGYSGHAEVHASGTSGALHLQAAVMAFRRGRADAAAGHFDQAVVEFRKAIDIEPTYLDAYRSLVRVYLEQQRWNEAGSAMTRLLQISPGATDIRLDLASMLEQQQQWMAALGQYNLVLHARPRDRDILYHFAVCAAHANLTEQALAAVQRGLTLDPADQKLQQVKRQIQKSSGAGSGTMPAKAGGDSGPKP